jgi:oxygen-independent coproporphyrinogen-3 oxidase
VLAREIDLTAPLVAGRCVGTVFLGGGTPTVLSPDELSRLLARLRRAFALAPDAEITCEANPEGVTPDRLDALAAAGVTRLSIGAQSAIAGELRAVHRTHDAGGVARAVACARRAGFRDINLDVMFGLPEQTEATWVTTLRTFLALGPDHLSLYGLTLEEGTPLARQVAAGRPIPDDECQARMYRIAQDVLDAGGWDHYEISNAARTGHRSRHNVGYWRRHDYIGLGPGAHSLLHEERTSNESDLALYAARLRAGERPLTSREATALADRVAETMFLGLRLADGIRLDEASEQLGVPLREVYARVLARHVAAGTLIENGGAVRLPRRYWFVAHSVLADFVEPDVAPYVHAETVTT